MKTIFISIAYLALNYSTLISVVRGKCDIIHDNVEKYVREHGGTDQEAANIAQAAKDQCLIELKGVKKDVN
jgi:hypothetical protein